jgi:hypothetical protein
MTKRYRSDMGAQCKKCGLVKPLDAFYKGHLSRDCRAGECADCTKARVKAHRQENIERIREYDRSRGCRQTRDMLRLYRERNPIKYRAHRAVNNALKNGRLSKPDGCEVCGSGYALHGHHDDYSRPLSVRWLCAACHHQWHAKHGEAKGCDEQPTAIVADCPANQ